MSRKLLITFASLLFTGHLFAQETKVSGIVTDSVGQPIELAAVAIEGTAQGTTTNVEGRFELLLEANRDYVLLFSFVGYETKKLTLKAGKGVADLNVVMKKSSLMLKQVEIEIKNEMIRDQVSITRISPKVAKEIPTAFGDFNQILATLPGVVSNSELSSQYSVRGGNFDENLVYVNDMLVYKPNLVRAGQQEGLSFVNPDMVESVEFSTGGWQPRYGDKLSSVMNVRYKKPTGFKGSLSAGLLGGTLHLEGAHKRFTWLAGVRHKRSTYLLNSLETKGEYLPQFTDIQAYFTYDLTSETGRSKGKETSLEVLTMYGQNRYFFRPQSRESTFGVFNESYRVFIGYIGSEVLKYDTYQAGAKLSKKYSRKLRIDWMSSILKTSEREYFDVEGGYRLCDVNTQFGTPGFNECISTIGIGSVYSSARNRMEADIYGLANRTYITPNSRNTIETGFYYSHEQINDRLSEYSFSDSSDYVKLLEVIKSGAGLQSDRIDGYVQHNFKISDNQEVTYGFRLSYWTLNQQLLFSPRMQYSIKPRWRRDFVFKGSVGVYQQPGFYRELRDRTGNLNLDLKAQSSLHVILGSDYNFKSWGRDFKFISEVYYKHLWNVVPYDLDNVRIRYYAQNIAQAYATGIDLRVNGEFIPGTESWFSMGIMSTKEDIEGDSVGFIRRPTDQRVTFGAVFQDHLPNNPTVRVYLNLVYGTGLPFGPPRATRFRNFFNAPQYRRVDIGFTKVISFNQEKKPTSRVFNEIWISLEVLNLLGTDNVISYLWVSDFRNRQFAVPNTLSQRFFNLRAIIRF